jgi:hypothetical protein
MYFSEYAILKHGFLWIHLPGHGIFGHTVSLVRPRYDGFMGMLNPRVSKRE